MWFVSLWYLRWWGFCLFLRFITTRSIESQKGTPHPHSITPPRPMGCFRNRKSNAYTVNLPSSLLHTLSKNPQGRDLRFGIEKFSRWLVRCCYGISDTKSFCVVFNYERFRGDQRTNNLNRRLFIHESERNVFKNIDIY